MSWVKLLMFSEVLPYACIFPSGYELSRSYSICFFIFLFSMNLAVSAPLAPTNPSNIFKLTLAYLKYLNIYFMLLLISIKILVIICKIFTRESSELGFRGLTHHGRNVPIDAVVITVSD